jgi:hypothetical protein
MVEIKQETKDKVKCKLDEAKTWCQEHKNVVVAAGIIVGGQCIKHALRTGRKESMTDMEDNKLYIQFDSHPVYDIFDSASSIAYTNTVNSNYTKSDIPTLVKELLLDDSNKFNEDAKLTGIIIGYKN